MTTAIPRAFSDWCHELRHRGSADPLLYPVAEEDVEWRQQISELSNEDRLLYDMVSDFHGGRPIHVRPDYLIFNSDDTKHFATEGIQPSNKKEWGLISTSALGTTGIIQHTTGKTRTR